MDIVGIAEVVSAVAVLIGFGFAVAELRRYRRRKARESALALVSSYQTPEFARAILLLIDLPDGLSKAELEERLGSRMELVSLLMGTWESLGVLAHRREVELDLIDDFFSGGIVLSWQKLQAFVEELRAASHRDTYFEWFQWLAERFLERESRRTPVPAHIEHRGWRERATSARQLRNRVIPLPHRAP